MKFSGVLKTCFKIPTDRYLVSLLLWFAKVFKVSKKVLARNISLLWVFTHIPLHCAGKCHLVDEFEKRQYLYHILMNDINNSVYIRYIQLMLYINPAHQPWAYF